MSAICAGPGVGHAQHHSYHVVFMVHFADFICFGYTPVSWFRYPVIFTFVTLESPVGFFFFSSESLPRMFKIIITLRFYPH
jgi:hypothetical protein